MFTIGFGLYIGLRYGTAGSGGGGVPVPTVIFFDSTSYKFDTTAFSMDNG